MTTTTRNMIIGGLLGLGLLVWLLQPILAPFLMATALAYLGDPLVDRLEERGYSRTVGVCLVFFALTLVGVILVLLLIPLLIRQIDTIRLGIPVFIDWLQASVFPWLSTTFGISTEWFEPERLRELVKANLGKTAQVWGPVLKQVTQSGVSLVQWSINLGLVPVVTFYLLRDWDVLVARIRKLVPRNREALVVRLSLECDEVLSAFVRGQLLVMMALGIFYTAGLALVGLKLALLIGAVAGLAAIVPYLGFVVGIVAAGIAAFVQFGDVFHLLLVAAVFGIGQALEGMVLTPLLVGDRIGLHPVAVIFAVLAGGQLFGFVGVLLALPVAAVIMVLLRHLNDRYLQSELYGQAASNPEVSGE